MKKQQICEEMQKYLHYGNQEAGEDVVLTKEYQFQNKAEHGPRSKTVPAKRMQNNKRDKEQVKSSRDLNLIRRGTLQL